jgi:glycine betaine catabolism B
MITFIDNLLNRITMYRLMLYYLIVLWVAAFIFGAFGIMPQQPLALIFSAVVIFLACWATNTFIAWVVDAPTNVESVYITTLILALIISPISVTPFNMAGLVFLIGASVFAMASKYILAIRAKHIFNPAAIAVVITAFVLNQYASWWVGGNLPLLAFVLIGGLLVIRKIQRFDMVLSFFAAAIVSILVTSGSADLITLIQKSVVHTTLLFFGFVMLSEPLTTPPTRELRVAYGVLVGALFSPAVHVGSIYSTPELTLIVGNVFSYLVSPKGKYMLSLKERTHIGGDSYDFAFEPSGKKLKFEPGQYMEWTLSGKGADSRGNRRYFTIASSPSENELHLGIKFPEGSSSFKKKFLTMKPGDRVTGGSLAGDFTLPRDASKKLVFVAGGIGITPFRSMVKYLSDNVTKKNGEKRDVVLLYSNRLASEISYAEVFDEAAKTIGLKTIYAITDSGSNAELMPAHHIHQGRIDAGLIAREIPDYKERLFYISGSHGMVVGFKKELSELGVSKTHIKTDFFPGF